MAASSHVTGVIDRLAAQAADWAGSDDFGPGSWREGLEILVRTAEEHPEVAQERREPVYREYVDALWNRLRVIDYAKRHPEVRDTPVERPLVVIGLPRTGTTVATSLLSVDQARRPLIKWEAVDSVPPPTTATLRTDPRCLALKDRLEEHAALRASQGIKIPHWEDADGATECAFVHGQDFRTFLWESAMPTPEYSQWFLAADITCTYEYERLLLQVLQSQAPGTWSLKLPSHSVHIEDLLKVFPDARVVWAHRDPYRAAASYLNMDALGRSRLTGPDARPWLSPPWVLEHLRASVDRPRRAIERLGDAQFFHLHYADLMRDPLGQIRELYQWAGDDLTPETEQAMRDWLRDNPQHRFGARPYSLAEACVTRADLEPVFADYLAAYDVELENG